MSALKEIREAASPALLHAPYRAAGERVVQANNHPQLRPYQLCGGTHSEFMAGSVAAALNVLPRLLTTVEAVIELHQVDRRPTSDHYSCDEYECDRSGEGELRDYCTECRRWSPCPTLQAITAALEGNR